MGKTDGLESPLEKLKSRGSLQVINLVRAHSLIQLRGVRQLLKCLSTGGVG